VEANGIVGDYQLGSYAKNALNRYGPQLTTTYVTNEFSDDHPVRFTNEAMKIEYKPENTIEWYTSKPYTTKTTTSGYQHNRNLSNGTRLKQRLLAAQTWGTVVFPRRSKS
jgi:hypothetical protein